MDNKEKTGRALIEEELNSIYALRTSVERSKIVKQWGITVKVSRNIEDTVYRLLREPEISESERSKLLRMWEDALYNHAYGVFAVGDAQNAECLLDMTDTERPGKPRLLRGYIRASSLFEKLKRSRKSIMREKDRETLAEEIYHWLSVLETDGERIFEEKFDYMDELLVARAYEILSLLYLVGDGVPRDVNKSRDILRDGHSRLENFEAKFEIGMQLMKYQKEESGNYSFSVCMDDINRRWEAVLANGPHFMTM